MSLIVPRALALGVFALWIGAVPVGCRCVPPADPPSPAPSAVTAGDIQRAELARVGGLTRLHARGVAELKTKDHQGEHFDQGDVDVRWNPSLGLAASLSKLGDRWMWIGSDATQWWSFDLKSKPTVLRTGKLTSAKAGLAPALPWLLGLRPLVPASGAELALVKNELRVAVATPQGLLPEGAELEAMFDSRTLMPTQAVLTLKDGTTWRSSFSEWISVDTSGIAQGAWPKISRRVQVSSGTDDRWTQLVVALDSARASPDAVDRPSLYNLVELRTRFAPQQVESEP